MHYSVHSASGSCLNLFYAILVSFLPGFSRDVYNNCKCITGSYSQYTAKKYNYIIDIEMTDREILYHASNSLLYILSGSALFSFFMYVHVHVCVHHPK